MPLFLVKEALGMSRANRNAFKVRGTFCCWGNGTEEIAVNFIGNISIQIVKVPQT